MIMAPATNQSIVLFGPQLTDVTANKLSVAREILSIHQALKHLRDTVLDFNSFGKHLEISDPALGSIGIARSSQILSKWMKGEDSEILQELDNHSNAISTPFTIIYEVLLYFQRLIGSSTTEDRVQIARDTHFEGLCVGQLVATAARLSTSLEHLARLSSVAVRLALCIGAYVNLDQHKLGDEKHSRCLAVTCGDGLGNVERLQSILSEFDSVELPAFKRTGTMLTALRRMSRSIKTRK